MEYPILSRTAAAYTLATRLMRVDNRGLMFDRYSPEVDTESDKEIKRRGLEAVLKAKGDKVLHEARYARWLAMASAPNCVRVENLATASRLVTGIGRNSPFEVGFAFDRLGSVTLPASGLKGITRGYALLEIARALKLARPQGLQRTAKGTTSTVSIGPLATLESLLLLPEKQETNTEGDDRPDELWPDGFVKTYGQACNASVLEMAGQFRLVFGRPSAAGRATFLDGQPVTLPELELDILNPHYPDYYQKAGVPHNAQQPKPVYFLALKAGTRFAFAVDWRGEVDTRARDQTVLWLRGALSVFGFGAKTSSGYGLFWAPEARATTAPSVAAAQAPNPGAKLAQVDFERAEFTRTKFDEMRIKLPAFDGARSFKQKLAEFGLPANLPNGTLLDGSYILDPQGKPKFTALRISPDQ